MDQQRLLSEMEREHKKWTFSTKVYGTLYPATRVYLIAVSAIVAANEALASSPLLILLPWVPILAVSVTIITAVDTWLKPRDKWRGFMRDRDELATLIIGSGGASPQDAVALESANAAFAELRRRHRDDNVY
jgi:hypothetical protein